MSQYTLYPPENGGGTGVTSLNTLTGALTLVAGTNITITPGVNTLTISSSGSGSVTSVGLADSTGLFNITGSPVTTAGTLTLASLQSQAANTVFAAPNGSSGAPTFRLLVAADIPALPYSPSALTSAHIFVGNGSNVATDVAVSGDLTLANTGAFTVAKIQGTTVSGTTGTGNVVFSASPTLTGTITAAAANFSGAITASNLSGTNTGDVTLAAFDSAPNNNGASLAGQVLTLQPADATHPGGVSTATQSFGGAKTFVAPLAISGSNTAALAVNGTSFVVDSTNNSLGLGVAPSTNAFLEAVNSSGATKRLQLTGYGTGSFVGARGRFARGTSGSPAAAQSGDVLSFISAQGFGATAFSATSTGVMNMVAGATFTDASMPTYMTFSVAPAASVTAAEAMRINSTSNVLIGTTTDDGASKLQVNGTLNHLNNSLINIKDAIFNGEVDDGNSGTSKTIDWTTGAAHKIAMTGNCAFTFTNPSGPCRVQLKMTQDATGSRTATWPTSAPKVFWPSAAPVLTPTATTGIDIVTFWFDGTNYYAVITQNFV